MTTKTDTRTQYRAICPICFRDHAIIALANARMVQHGYQRPEGWHQNVGECNGTSVLHFGTPEGREAAANNARWIRSWAETRRAAAADLRAAPPATVTIDGKYLGHGKGCEQLTIDATDYRYAAKIESMIYTAETEARHADQSAAIIEKRIAEWKPVDPRPVQVATGPTMHFAFKWYRTGVGCVYSSGRDVVRHSTADWSKVTCTRCLKQRDELEQRAIRLEERAAEAKRRWKFKVDGGEVIGQLAQGYSANDQYLVLKGNDGRTYRVARDQATEVK